MISLMAISPPVAFDHYLVTKLSAHMHLFLVFALVFASLEHIRRNHEKADTETVQKPVRTDKRILSRAAAT